MNPTPFVNLAQLKGHIRTLITPEETAMGLKRYVNLGATPNFIPDPAQRGLVLGKVLRRQERERFQEALDQIEACKNELHPLTTGIAAFSRAGSRPFFLGLQFQMPRRTACPSLDAEHLRPGGAQGDLPPLRRADRERGTDPNLRGKSRSHDAQPWTWRPELRERSAATDRQRNQSDRRQGAIDFSRRRSTSSRSLYRQWPHQSHSLRQRPPDSSRADRRPKHVVRNLSTRLGLGERPCPDVVAQRYRSFIEREEQESRDAVAQLVGGLPWRLAVAGRGRTSRRARGQADVLSWSRRNSPSGWECEGCGWADAAPYARSVARTVDRRTSGGLT